MLLIIIIARPGSSFQTSLSQKWKSSQNSEICSQYAHWTESHQRPNNIAGNYLKCISWRFFAKTSSELRPLHSAGCLPAKWRHVESKEAMYAVISSVKTRAINTAAPISNFSVPRMKQGKNLFLFMKDGIIWSHITLRKTHKAHSVLAGHHVQVNFLTIGWLWLDWSAS